MTRPSKREHNQLRAVSIERGFTPHAEGSALVKFGNTHVLCNASVITGVPRFLKGQGQAWLTAEYGMLPRATGTRTDREAARGKQSGRTQEIQRLIGRSLRQAVELRFMPEYTIVVDCDVISADGGTRTAAITGAAVAVYDALKYFKEKKLLSSRFKLDSPMKQLIASVSVGIYKGQAVLDLDYDEDSNADTDMNVVMSADGRLIEIQGTAEHEPFSLEQLNQMLALAQQGISELIALQKAVLELND